MASKNLRKIYTPEEYRQRPKDVDYALAEQMLERIENGETLIDICGEDRDMPMPGTFLRWCDEDPGGLGERHAAARRRGADVNFDEALTAAYDNDTHRGNARSNALRWHVERSSPEKYSPRAIMKNTTAEEVPGGYDSTAEIRRRVEAMAEIHKGEVAQEDSGQATP